MVEIFIGDIIITIIVIRSCSFAARRSFVSVVALAVVACVVVIFIVVTISTIVAMRSCILQLGDLLYLLSQ